MAYGILNPNTGNFLCGEDGKLIRIKDKGVAELVAEQNSKKSDYIIPYMVAELRAIDDSGDNAKTNTTQSYSIYVSVRNKHGKELASLEIDRETSSDAAERKVEEYSKQTMRGYPSINLLLNAVRFANHISYNAMDNLIVVVMKKPID